MAYNEPRCMPDVCSDVEEKASQLQTISEVENRGSRKGCVCDLKAAYGLKSEYGS